LQVFETFDSKSTAHNALYSVKNRENVIVFIYDGTVAHGSGHQLQHPDHKRGDSFKGTVIGIQSRKRRRIRK
jgi:hypothetical protein